MDIDFLFNSIDAVPKKVINTLYSLYNVGIDFTEFINLCNQTAAKYNLSGDCLNSYIVEMWEDRHPEIVEAWNSSSLS